MRWPVPYDWEAWRIGRDPVVHTQRELAWHVGSEDDTIESIRAAVQEIYGPRMYLKQAILPYPEKWLVRFLRHPGGWVVTCEKVASPDPGVRIPGDKAPQYVRLVVPMRKDGVVPRSLAPRREDLPRLLKGKWFGVTSRSRVAVPCVITTIDAPRWGVTVSCKTSSVQPVLLAFPFTKKEFDESVRRLRDEVARERSEQAKERNSRGLNRRKGSPHRPERAAAAGAEDPEPEAVSVLQARTRLRRPGADREGGSDGACAEAARLGGGRVRGGRR